MKIDWFTVIAQAFNFLVLVWLLKRFLYRPVLQAISEREQKIAAQLKEAEARTSEARKEQEEFLNKNEVLERQRMALLQKATEEAGAERLKLLTEVRQEATLLRSRLKESIREEQQRLSGDVSRRIREEVFALSRKVLSDLSSMELNAQIIEVFVQRLQTLGEDEKKQLASVLAGSSDAALVRSSFVLSGEQQEKIEKAILEIFSGARIQFGVIPEETGGLELIISGYRIGWSIQDYISSMEKNLDMLLQEDTKEETASVKK